MKLIRFGLLLALLVLITVHDSVEVVPIGWFLRVAAALGVKLVKNSYYARCNSVGIPPGVRCPDIAFGAGLSRGQAPLPSGEASDHQRWLSPG